MKKVFIVLALLAMVNVRAEDAALSEDVTIVKDALVTKQGDITELVELKEKAVEQVENLAARGKSVQGAIDYLESRIKFDPRKEGTNRQKLQKALDRIKDAVKKSDALAVKAVPAA